LLYALAFIHPCRLYGRRYAVSECPLVVFVFVYFTNTRLLLAKIEKIYINVVVYKTIFHERFYFGIYFDSF
jgi:hypothetical protein